MFCQSRPGLRTRKFSFYHFQSSKLLAVSRAEYLTTWPCTPLGDVKSIHWWETLSLNIGTLPLGTRQLYLGCVEIQFKISQLCIVEAWRICKEDFCPESLTQNIRRILITWNSSPTKTSSSVILRQSHCLSERWESRETLPWDELDFWPWAPPPQAGWWLSVRLDCQLSSILNSSR